MSAQPAQSLPLFAPAPSGRPNGVADPAPARTAAAQARRWHDCHCGRFGCFGYGGSVWRGRLFIWRCGAHRPEAAS